MPAGIQRGGNIADARAGDPAAMTALNGIATWLGIGLASLVNVFNPTLVVLGGVFERIHPMVAPAIDRVLAERSLLASRELVNVVPGQLGVDAPILGAAELAFEELLADPVLSEWTIYVQPFGIIPVSQMFRRETEANAKPIYVDCNAISPPTVDKVAAADLLQHIASGASHDRVEQRLVVGERGQHEHGHVRVFVADVAAGQHSGAVGQAHVHDDHVGFVGAGAQHRVGGGAGSAQASSPTTTTAATRATRPRRTR